MGLKKRTRRTLPVDAESNQHHSQIKVIQEISKLLDDIITNEYLNTAILFKSISMGSYAWNLWSNIYSLKTYYIEGYYCYFGFLLACIVLSGVITVYESYRFYNQNGHKYIPRDLLPPESLWNWAMKWAFGFFLTCSIPRYWDIIQYAWKAKQGKKTNDDAKKIYYVAMIWEDAELTTLNQFRCFTQSAAQLLLNLYIMLKDESNFGISSMILLIFSIASLSMALFSYDQKISLMNGIKRDEEDRLNNQSISIGVNDTTHFDIDKMINTKWTDSSFLLFFAHFFWIVSRLIALSLFATGYGWLIWPACFAHLIPTFIWHLNQNYGIIDSMRLSFLHLFAYLYPLANESDKLKHPRLSPVMYQSVCSFENIFLVFLWTVSLEVGDGTLHHGILSVLPYPWTHIVPWIVTLTTMALSCLMFWCFYKYQQDKTTNAYSSVTTVTCADQKHFPMESLIHTSVHSISSENGTIS